MIATIIKREFLDNILSFKFAACVLVAIVISLASTAILTRDYQERLRNYDKGVAAANEALTKVPVYSSLKVRLFRKPTPLSIFAAGIERKAGNFAEISLLYQDIPASLQGGVAKNEFAGVFSLFDFSAVIIIVFTVLAILLSYDAISGEKEEGMLSLVLSNSVPRAKILFGKYLGALIAVAMPLALCFILGILYVLFSKAASLSANFLMFMGLLYSVSLLYLSCILFLGILASSRTRTSFGSLLFLLVFFLVFSFLIPQAVKSASNNAIRSRTKNLEMNIQALLNERYQGGGRSSSKPPPFKKTWVIPRDGENMMLYGGIILRRITSPEYIENQNLTTAYQMKTEREYAQKAFDLKMQDVAIEERILHTQNRLLAFVPSASFGRIVELAADTGDESMKRYLHQISVYWHQLMDYLEAKGAYGTRFCYPGPDEQTTYEKDLVRKITEDRAGWVHKIDNVVTFYQGRYYNEAMSYKLALTFLDLRDLPVLKTSEPEFATRLRQSLFNIGILTFYNILLFVLAYFSFANCDPRRAD
jgi:ABC-type transport system involved in multi-copper enzyme maturation permease subunit